MSGGMRVNYAYLSQHSALGWAADNRQVNLELPALCDQAATDWSLPLSIRR